MVLKSLMALLAVIGCMHLQAQDMTTQFAGATFSSGPDCNMEILQVENLEFSTLLYMAYTTPSTDDWDYYSKWMTFEDKTYLQIPNSTQQYRLISTINMPICSEAESRYMWFERQNQRHQFVLEFERIPDGTSFDIIECIGDSTAFNFYDVTYTPADSTNHIDIDQFIGEYPVKEFGQFAVNGEIASYMKYKDIVVSVIPRILDQYGKYYNMDISIQNYTAKSILFNPNNINVTGHKSKKKYIQGEKTIVSEQQDMTLLSYSQYDAIIQNKQNWTNFFVGLCEGLAAYGAGRSYYTTTTYSGRSYITRRFDWAAAYAAQQQASANCAAYAANQRQIRQQIGEGYAKLHTIPSETEYSGYFNIKYKKIDKLFMDIIINGEVYPFIFVF